MSLRLVKLTACCALVVVLTACQSLLPLVGEKPSISQQPPAVAAKPIIKVEQLTKIDIQPAASPELKPSDIWDRIRVNLEFNDVTHSDIEAHYRWYKKHPSYMKRVTARAEPFIYYIVEEIERRGIPMDLALLPIVESAFDPFAYSHGRASGLWQFIPGTGKHYGLRQDWWYDGRRDVIASTNGALNYLEYLHRRFDGDWLLAVAAYNSGEGNVGRAIKRNKKRNRPTDFWHLKLPKETQAYVPKLLALSALLAEKLDNKVVWTPVADQPYFAEVDTGGQLDLAKAASMANVSVDDIYRLNPAFNRWATSPDGPHKLLIPVDRAEQFAEQMANLDQADRITWMRYQIQSGDSLLRIAKKYNTTVELLRDINQINGNTIRAGKKLLVPAASQRLSSYSLSASNRLQKKQSTRRTKNKYTHVVQSGDSFWDLSRKYKVNYRSLAKWNGMAPTDPLKVGQKLVIWKNETLKFADAPIASLKQRRKIRYTVRSGDSLARISQKFKVKVADVKKWNPNANTKYIHPGQDITLYVDVAAQTAE